MKPLETVGKMRIRLFLMTVLLLSLLTACGTTFAADSAPVRDPGAWQPTRPITMICGYAAGGNTDITARIIGVALQEYFGVPCTVLNITGASGSIAGQSGMQQPADGHTILGLPFHIPGTWAVSGFNEIRPSDFYWLGAGTGEYVIAVANDSKWKTIEEMVEDIRANPGVYKYSISGHGGQAHIAGELFAKSLGLDVSTIPYTGGREALVRTMAGDVDYNYAGFPDIADLVEAGEARVLGFASNYEGTINAPTPYHAPSIPSIYPELLTSSAELRSGFGMFWRRETPPEITAELYKFFKWMMEQERFVNMLKERYVVITWDNDKGEEIDLEIMKSESLHAWAMYDIGIAAKSPEEFGIPRIENFKWPPHDAAKNMQPWPKGLW